MCAHVHARACVGTCTCTHTHTRHTHAHAHTLTHPYTNTLTHADTPTGSCLAFANTPAKRREMDDNSKKLGLLLWRLNAGEVSEGVLPKLAQLCQAIQAADWHTANHIQVGALRVRACTLCTPICTHSCESARTHCTHIPCMHRRTRRPPAHTAHAHAAHAPLLCPSRCK